MEEKININCEIGKQEAETIINVNGSLYNIRENKILDNKNLLKKYYQLDYGAFLEKNCKNKKTIIREDVLSDIYEKLEKVEILLLYGNPGVGKSFIASEIKKNYETIYISVNKKSEKEIYLYLISKFLTKEEIENKNLISIEDIKTELELNMMDREKLFIFDDIEKNPNICEIITSLELFKNKVLFISRIRNLKFNKEISEYELKGFSIEEIKYFLQFNNIKLNNIKLDELIEKSQGNPLYLYYFSHYQITPLPEGVLKFQETLWQEMTPFQKNILSFISLPLFSLTFKEIKKCIEVLNKKIMDSFNFQKEMEKISYLLIKNEKKYFIFHSSLSEYILEILEELEIDNEYKKILAKIKIENEDFLEAVHLLLDVSESEFLKEIIFFPLNEIRELGLFEFGIKVLKKAIKLYSAETTDETNARGFAYNRLTLFYNDLYMINESKEANELSIKCFEKTNNLMGLLNAKLFKAMDLIKENKREEAKSLVENIKEKIPEKGYLKSSLCVNLSKFYLDLNDYKEAKKYAEISYIEFQKETNESIKLEGVKTSLSYLTISYSFLDGKENLEKSIEYGELLYNISLEINDLRTRVSVCNSLTRSYRELNNYEKAYIVCDEAIRLSKSMKSNGLIIVNIINKGNIYKKERKFKEALQFYEEAKEYSVKNNILAEEVRVLKLISDIYLEIQEYEKGKIVIKEFLEKSKKSGIYYRISEAYYNFGRISYYLNEKKWKIYLLKSLKITLKAKEYEEVIDDTFKIINLFKENLKQSEIIFCFGFLIEKNVYKVNLEKFLFFVAINDSINFSQKIDILKLIIEKSDIETVLTRDILINFIEAIQKYGIISFDKILELMKEFLDRKDREEFLTYFLISIIGFSKNFNKENQDKLFEEISIFFERFYYRKIQMEEFILTICSEELKLQIIGKNSNLAVSNLAIIIGILIKTNIKKIIEELNILNKKNYTIIIENFSNVLKYEKEKNEEIIKEIEEQSKDYILGIDKEDKTIWIFIKDDFQDNIYLLKDGEKLGLLDILLHLFMVIFKVEKNELKNPEEKIVELLISIFLPRIKAEENLSSNEEINIFKVKNDVNKILRKSY